MSLELENIILTCDSREKNPRRVKAIEQWAVSLGAIVEHSKLDLGDYALVGEFRGLPVNLGIEAKGWDNFLSDRIEDMEDKLVRSQEVYDEVALFIETGNYTFKPQANNHCILDHSNPKLELESKTLAAFEGFCDTLQSNRIHVRQLRSEAQFPYSIYNLLVYCTEPHVLDKGIRNGLTKLYESIRNGTLEERRYKKYYADCLARLPTLNTFKRIDKVMKHYPSLFWLTSASEESLIEVVGKQVGMTLYAWLHYRGLETPEWRKGHHLDGTDVLMCEHEGKPCEAVNAYQCIGEICKHHPSHPGDSITPITQKPDDPRPPQCVIPCDAVKQGKLLSTSTPAFLSPAEIPFPVRVDKELDIGLSSQEVKLEGTYRILCRACHQVIPEDTETGFCQDPECIAERKKPTVKMSINPMLREFFIDGKPHELSEFIEVHNFNPGSVYDKAMNAVKKGLLKKVTVNNKVTFQKVI